MSIRMRRRLIGRMRVRIKMSLKRESAPRGKMEKKRRYIYIYRYIVRERVLFQKRTNPIEYRL